MNGGIRSIERAISIVEANRKRDDPTSPAATMIENASMAALAEALLQKIATMPRQEYLALRDREYETADQDIETLTDLAEQLNGLLSDV